MLAGSFAERFWLCDLSQFAEVAEYGPNGKINHKEILLGNVYIVVLESSVQYLRGQINCMLLSLGETKNWIKSLPWTLNFFSKGYSSYFFNYL